jgi:hypothetical protein
LARDAGKKELTMLNLQKTKSTGNRRYDYLIQEFRCAILRARLEVADLEAIALALRAGLITAEQALDHVSNCGCLRWIQPPNHVEGAAA